MSSENLNPGAFSHATDLKNRILFTIFLLIIYRLGTYIPLSGIDPEALKEVMSASQKGLLQCWQEERGWCCLQFNQPWLRCDKQRKSARSAR